MRKPTPIGHTIRGHAIRLDPTIKQANALARAAGVSRFTYNWALTEWNRQYAAGIRPSMGELRRQFNALKGEQFPWIYESPRDANSQAFVDLDAAFNNFFSSCRGGRKGRRMNPPTLHRRGVNDSFYVANDRFSLRKRGKRGVVRLPVIGDVRMQEHLRFDGKILSGRVYREADRWFISINVEFDARVQHVHECAIVGIDLGLKTAVIPSHGDSEDAPKPLQGNLRQLVRATKKLHRRVKGGRNRNKARVLLARMYQRITNIRKDFWHKLTTRLCRENQTVVIEDLELSFMLKNRSLARVAMDVGLGRFKPMLLYKAPMYGGAVVVADRFFPSTQRCSNCGFVKTGDEKIVLGVSEYTCDKCGFTEDRDRNAALNLEQYPRLAGNWGQKAQTPMDDRTSTCSVETDRACMVAEVGTESCSLGTSRRAVAPGSVSV